MLITALVTPFKDGGHVDGARVTELVEFQLGAGAERVLLAGTTGEGAALSDDERAELLQAALAAAPPECLMLALGSGRVADLTARGRAALNHGVRDLLLADCPYVGAASGALREHWHGPVASALPEARLVAYVIPSRTGSELQPEDLARLAEDHPNVVGVKEATGSLERMARVRALLGDRLALYCGDDHLLAQAVARANIRVDGAISFAANLVPCTVADVAQATAGQAIDVLRIAAGLVGVDVEETVIVDGRPLAARQRARNPVPLKAALGRLGVMSASCRPPLGPLGPAGLAVVDQLLELLSLHPSQPLEPIRTAFGMDVPPTSREDGSCSPPPAVVRRAS